MTHRLMEKMNSIKYQYTIWLGIILFTATKIKTNGVAPQKKLERFTNKNYTEMLIIPHLISPSIS